MITMRGHDRTFVPPRSVRRAAADFDVEHGIEPMVRKLAMGQVTMWDMLSPQVAAVSGAQEWCDRSLEVALERMDAIAADAMDCPDGDCADTGFYGIPDASDPDLLTALVRRVNDADLEVLSADGCWSTLDTGSVRVPLETLSLSLATDLAEAVVTGSSGLMRRFSVPLAFLSPAPCHGVVAAAEVIDGMPPVGTESPDAPSGAKAFAIVDDLDTGAVLDLIRIAPGPEIDRYIKQGEWENDPDLVTRLKGMNPPPLVELSEDQLTEVTEQIDANPEDDGESTEPNMRAASAGPAALVADAPLTVSPDPRAEKLRRYWSTGEGAAKIRWGTPGDWKRCYKHLAKYMGVRAKGYCQNLHRRNTGVWTGDKRNASGARVAAALSVPSHGMEMSTEENLAVAIAAGGWIGEGNTDMGTLTGIRDGIYREAVPEIAMVRGLTAAGSQRAVPTHPPAEWFADPKFDRLTALTVEDTGQVYGHLADFKMPHIGLPGSVKPPRNSSGYAFFKTGTRVASGGEKVRVGQLTLTGGHASMNADAGRAVAHYDNTQSAVADVNVGEDKYGIWFAGSLRPGVTEEQVIAFMASSLSGDWRPINGKLEMVACCSVNVPGYPIAACAYRGGSITALVAAGARSLAELQLARRADAAMVDRVQALEQAVFTGITTVEAVEEVEATAADGAVGGEPVVTDESAVVVESTEESEPEAAAETAIDRARRAVAERNIRQEEETRNKTKMTLQTRAALRARVHKATVASGPTS